ncbi:MAG: MBL fold metallo-hydrolase [Gemmatimonadales bacterium]
MVPRHNPSMHLTMPAFALPILITALELCAFNAAAQPQAPAELRVTFLGTAAGPAPPAEYAGTSTLVEFGTERILIDVGRGAVQRLQQANVNPSHITAVFLTHLHSDHTVGLPELWLTGWWRSPRQAPLEVRGPEGTKAMTADLERAWSYDITIRTGPPERLRRATAALIALDVGPGVVFDRNGVRVTAIVVDHGPVRAFGYRIDAGGHSVVFSGDDRASENLVAAARGVDLFVHSILAFTPEELADTTAVGARRRAALEMLGTPEQVGLLFARALPKLAVFYHYGRNPTILPRTRAVYSGPLELAEDLMQITIGDRIVVNRLPSPRP